MRNCDEIAKSVLEKRDLILRKKTERRKNMLKTASTVAVFCLAVLIGIGVFSQTAINDEAFTNVNTEFDEIGTYPVIRNELFNEDGHTNDKREDERNYPYTTAGAGGLTLVEGTTAADSYKLTDPISTMEIDSSPNDNRDAHDAIDLPPSDSTEVRADIALGLFYINSIIGEATPAKRAYDKKDHYGLDYSAEEMEAYIGIDIDSIMHQLPDDMTYIPHKHNVIMKTNGDIAYDAAHFLIEDGKGGVINISAGRVLPPYDCIYMLSSESTSELKTEKGTVTVLAGGKDYDEKKGTFGFFFADFQFDGVYYRIEVENIYREKIIATLLNMILGKIELS